MKEYIKPESRIIRFEVQNMLAASIVKQEGTANGSDARSNMGGGWNSEDWSDNGEE